MCSVFEPPLWTKFWKSFLQIDEEEEEELTLKQLAALLTDRSSLNLVTKNDALVPISMNGDSDVEMKDDNSKPEAGAVAQSEEFVLTHRTGNGNEGLEGRTNGSEQSKNLFYEITPKSSGYLKS